MKSGFIQIFAAIAVAGVSCASLNLLSVDEAREWVDISRKYRITAAFIEFDPHLTRLLLLREVS